MVSPGLELWSLERRLVGDGDWTSFATGTQLPVTALLDPTLMLNGLYEVRATATDTGGQVSDGPEVTIEVSGQMKVGELELTFLDAQIPLLGIPIELYRHYDSRDRGDHEFGRSWNMQVGSVRLQKSQPAGEQWFWDRSTGLFPTYCFEPVRPKVVTVRLPGNQLHEFEARFEPRCSFLVPPDAGKIVYAARPGTNSTLRPLGTDEVIRDGSELFDLVDQDTAHAFDPTVFVLSLHDGRQLTVDDAGHILNIADTFGNSVTFEEGGITHSTGEALSLIHI